MHYDQNVSVFSHVFRLVSKKCESHISIVPLQQWRVLMKRASESTVITINLKTTLHLTESTTITVV